MLKTSLNVKSCANRKRSVSILLMTPEEVENGAGLRLVLEDLDAHQGSCLEQRIATVAQRLLKIGSNFVPLLATFW